MLNKTAIAGIVTWDGTLTVLMTDTSGVAVGDWIKMGTDDLQYFKVTAVTPNVSVTIENPSSLDVLTGAGGFITEEGIRDEISVAADVVSTPNALEEDVTEPSAPANTKRSLADDLSSATVHPTKKYRVSHTYMNAASHAGWGGRGDFSESIV